MATSLASMILSDNGAEVVLVEPPGGDPFRSRPAWRMWSRGTKSIVLDLARQEDRKMARALVEGADVVIEGWRPGEGEQLGLDFTTTAATNPGLVHCALSAMGTRGPYASIPTYDGLVEARSGRFVDLGIAFGRAEPAFRSRPNSSYAAAQGIVQGVSAALLARERTGQGQQISTNLYQGLLAYDFGSALRRQNELGLLDPPLPDRSGYFLPFLPYLPVRTKDGVWVQITNNTGRLFRAWMSVLGLDYIYEDDRLKGAPSEFPNQETKIELAKLMLAQAATRTFDEWMDIFIRDGLTGDRYLTTQQAMDHPQILHNNLVVDVHDAEVGPTRQLGLLVAFSKTPGTVERGAPQLDEHRGTVAPRPAPAARERRAPKPGGPLAGMLLLDFASWLAGPFGTSLMADLGARVIKIEPPIGDLSRAGLGGRG
ncbi:MAG TPA: CoA transferase, partial [Acidimicrobiales bacterium]|nr:CoA transferase [Acidimicrobiales bacterium]